MCENLCPFGLQARGGLEDAGALQELFLVLTVVFEYVHNARELLIVAWHPRTLATRQCKGDDVTMLQNYAISHALIVDPDPLAHTSTSVARLLDHPPCLMWCLAEEA